MYTELAHPLYRLLVLFEWIEECQQAYDDLKKSLSIAPVLRAPNWDLLFHLHIDASNFAIGCVLAQLGESSAMVYVMKKFRHYLLDSKFVFFVDHQALLYLVPKGYKTRELGPIDIDNYFSIPTI